MELLERRPFVCRLTEALVTAGDSGGHIALVGGEAGVGKTSLVDHFTAPLRREGRVLWGSCDALFTPRPLGPLHDIALDLENAELLNHLESGAGRSVLYGAVLRELQRPGAPRVVVVEDVHWADEATLDLLKYLSRRVRHTNALIIATYRDDEVGPGHLLHHLLGELPPRSTTRLALRPLSEASVAALAEAAGQRGEGLYAATGGNPFYVTEVLAGGSVGVPASVRDAVLARVARLSAPARARLELVSVVPSRAERWLLDEALGADPAAVEECLQAGVLRAEAGAFVFRHELARQAVEDALSAPARQALHARVLRVLHGGTGGAEATRLVHHAAAAGDAASVLASAPRAARQAAALSAHRQAAAHYRTALRYADGLPPEARAELLEGLAYECYLTEQIAEALEARHAALALWQLQGNREAVGRSLRWLSRLSWFAGSKADAERYADEAIAVLEALPPGPELAMAYSNRSQLHMLSWETPEAVLWGQRAIAQAEAFGDTEILAHALNNVGTALLTSGDLAGAGPLERSLQLSLEHELQEHAGRAYTNIATSYACFRDHARAMRYYDEGIAYTAERDLDAWWLYLKACRARACLDRGLWTEAADDASAVLAHPHASTTSRIPALAALGHVRVRRGDPAAAPVLEQALVLAKGTGETQRIAPVVAARAEAAWLAGRPDEVGEELERAYALALAHGEAWAKGLLGFWMWRFGALAALPDAAARPYVLHAAGRWREAAGLWATLQSPYEQALALADGDEAAQREALLLFDRLGAAPAADGLRRRMREDGLQRVPRGPRPATRAHPAGLTRRQRDVLALLVEGRSNADIAARLFIAQKTADHHVSAVLAKLGVRSRSEAAALAMGEGLLAEPDVEGEEG